MKIHSFQISISRIRQIIYYAMFAITALFFIDQFFFHRFTLLALFTAITMLIALIGRKYLLIKKDFELQAKLTQELKQQEREEQGEKTPEEPKEQWNLRSLNLKIPLQKHTREALNLLRKADIIMRAGNALSEAHKLLIQALSFAPENVEAQYKLALLYLEQKEYKKAEVILKKLINIEKNADYFYVLGRSLEEQERLTEAATYYEEASHLEPKKADYLASLAKIYWQLGKKEESMQYYFQASELDPRNPGYLTQLIQYHQEKGSLKDHQYLLKKLLLIYPDDEAVKESLRELQKEE